MHSNFFSQNYQDIYFNPDDPEAEKQFVFIEANQIAERITSTPLQKQETEDGRSAGAASETFVVAELGFGFGLNCALTRHAAKKADCLHKLRYFSVEENFPPQPAIQALAEKLKICRQEYETIWTPSPPDPLSRRQRGSLDFPLPPGEGSRVRVGNVRQFLSSADFLADAWYFDGFSPDKNPEMWSIEVFAAAYALTKSGGTFSTYSSAGWVRRNLEAAGFIVNRTKGFAAKREMLVGYKGGW